ncbi:MAG: 50S ribosomal protein L4 [Candidatus Omnitrophota bacterium]
MRKTTKTQHTAQAQNALPVYNTTGKEIDKLSLDIALFDGTVNEAVLHQVIVGYLANRRRGTASTKTRSEVSGGGKKPWKQKGTGRARASSIRSPLWRHGGVTFGPHPRAFGHKLTKQVKTKALISSLNAKLRDGEIKILESVELKSPKTKELVSAIEKLKIGGSILFVVDGVDNNLKLAARNLSWMKVMRQSDLNAYEVLAYKNILLTKKAIEGLISTLK